MGGRAHRAAAASRYRLPDGAVDRDGHRSSNMIAASSPNSFSWWSRDRVDQRAQLLGGEFSRRRRPDDEAGERLEPELGATRAAPSVMPSVQSSTRSPGSRMMTWTWRAPATANPPGRPIGGRAGDENRGLAICEPAAETCTPALLRTGSPPGPQ